MKKLLSLLSALFTVILLFSCAAQDKQQNELSDQSAQSIESEESITHIDNSNVPVKTDLLSGIVPKEVQAKSADGEFVISQTELALKLFKAAAESGKGENMLISPLSLELALSMTANGAYGKTREEMQALLGNGISLEDLNGYLKGYTASLPCEEGSKLTVSNSVWFRNDEKRFNAEPDFLQLVADYYGAQAYSARFDESTAEEMNGWVNEKTDGMIDKLVNKIEDDEVMYLINALCFDAEWENIYNEYNIINGEFHTLSGEKREVEMMYSEESIYYKDENAIGFKKNYKGGYSFVALLPDEGTDIYDYVNSLTAERLASLLSNPSGGAVFASIPKFSYDYEKSFNDILSSLGMPTAFKPEQADFSLLGRSSAGNVFVSKVLQKTFISVDERGTKAGAVTSVHMTDESMPETPIFVNLDRPFVYMIIDEANNLPIFTGIVVDPS